MVSGKPDSIDFCVNIDMTVHFYINSVILKLVEIVLTMQMFPALILREYRKFLALKL